MNNKGFAITTVLYGTFLLFMMLLLAMLGILSTYKDKMEILIENTNGARDIIEGKKEEVEEEQPPVVENNNLQTEKLPKVVCAGYTYTGTPKPLVYVSWNEDHKWTFYWSRISAEDAKKNKNTTIPTETNAGDDYVVYWYSPDDKSVNCLTTGWDCKRTCYIVRGYSDAIIHANEDLKYNGSAQELVRVSMFGDAPKVDVYFSLSKALTKDNYKNDGFTKIPTGKSAGTYKVYYYAEGDSNHQPSVDNKYVEVTISS